MLPPPLLTEVVGLKARLLELPLEAGNIFPGGSQETDGLQQQQQQQHSQPDDSLLLH